MLVRWTNVMRGVHPLSVPATMAVLLLIVAVTVRDGFQAPTVAEATQASACTNGIVVPDPVNNPGLVSDCEVLLSARDTLAGTATLDWSVSNSIEEWEGVRVRGVGPRVTRLSLNYRGPNGEIPSTLGNLSYLEILHLDSNQLTGAIPAELGQLARLEILHLSQNQLTGEIPFELGNLTELRRLNLAHNQLEGPIPAELGSLGNLEELNLWQTGLSGPIPPELGNLSKLYWMSLGENALSGSIPSELGNLSDLEVLHLSGNELTGEIPDEFGSLSNLTFMSLDANQLTGQVPVSLGNLSNLEVLHLNENELSGYLPPELGNLSNLEVLHLNENELSGYLPPELGNLSNLVSLYISNNRFSGQFPSSLGELMYLQELYVAGNTLTGCIPNLLSTVPNNDLAELGLPFCTLPADWDCSTGIAVRDPSNNSGLVSDCEVLLAARDILAGSSRLNWSADTSIRNWDGVTIGYLVSTHEARVFGIILDELGLNGKLPSSLGSLLVVEQLNLSGNQLSGPIPPELGQLSSLKVLSLNDNQLTGPVPLELGNLVSLEWLFLEGNQLAGPIPPELGQLSGLTALNLGHNQLTGPLPSELGSLSNLEDLYLQVNGLDGPIPAELFELTNLRNLYLSENQLSGTIPTDLLQLSGLESLNLSHNQFTGAIPNGLSNLRELKLLSLAGNQLEGPIPSELGSLTKLEHLGLVRSGLTGPIPPELGNLSGLKWLSLAHNGLTGSVPPELGGLSELEELYLEGNELTGKIPSELGDLSKLQLLYLRDNQLTGEIPGELSNLSDLTHLYLSHNELTGPIPQELGDLTNLLHLHLAHNRLTGSIPSDLGMLTYLIEMDLSENRLSGQVPPELGDLADLEILDLTGNQLTGCIPSGLPDETTDYLYVQGLFACEDTPPEPPFIRRAVFTADSLIVTWSAPIRIGSSPIFAYDLRYIDTALDETVASNWTLLEDVWTADSGSLSYELTGLTDGITYDLQVRGENDVGDGQWSNRRLFRPGVSLAQRSFSQTLVEGGGELVVTITARGYGLFGAVLETLPAGFNFVSSSLSEHAVHVMAEELRFILFNVPPSFTYTVTTPSGDGSYTFSGGIMDQHRSVHEIGGASVIIVQSAPTVEISYTAGSGELPLRIGAPISLTATFNEPVSGFTIDDLIVVNGTADNFSGADGGIVYTFDVTPESIGNVTVDILSGVAGDSVGYGNEPVNVFLGIPYDDDRDGTIGRSEVLTAVNDYFNGDLAAEHALDVVRFYFSSSD